MFMSMQLLEKYKDEKRNNNSQNSPAPYRFQLLHFSTQGFVCLLYTRLFKMLRSRCSRIDFTYLHYIIPYIIYETRLLKFYISKKTCQRKDVSKALQIFPYFFISLVLESIIRKNNYKIVPERPIRN